MYEHRTEPVLPREAFLRRVSGHVVVSIGIVALSLAMGTCGYHWFGQLGWIDAVENASMILTGMGPVDTMKDTPSKLFASAYALFSGVVFLSAVGIVLAPVFHRVLHHFHLDEEDERE